MDRKIAVIGDAESIKGYAAVGFDIFPFSDAESAGKLLRQISEGDTYGIIYLTEELYISLTKDIERCRGKLLPAVIPIPGARGGTGIGIRRLSSFVEKAVGSDIIFNN